MSTVDRLRRVARTREALTTMLEHLGAAERQWAEQAPGVRAQSFTPPMSTYRVAEADADDNPDDDSTGRHTVADPTGDAATTPNAARRAELDLDETLERLERAAQHAAVIVTRWAVDRPLKAAELQALELQGDPGCEVVARIKRPDGSTWWEPEHRLTDLDGLLDRPHRLGRWAYDFARRECRLPSVAETVAHLEGRRVTARIAES